VENIKNWISSYILCSKAPSFTDEKKLILIPSKFQVAFLKTKKKKKRIFSESNIFTKRRTKRTRTRTKLSIFFKKVINQTSCVFSSFLYLNCKSKVDSKKKDSKKKLKTKIVLLDQFRLEFF
jgi:hypothetical protein